MHASANVIGSSISQTGKQSILMSPKKCGESDQTFPFGVWSGHETTAVHKHGARAHDNLSRDENALLAGSIVIV